MMDVKTELERIETELGEWKEELGDQFPFFLNHVLVARLMKSEFDRSFYEELYFKALR